MTLFGKFKLTDNQKSMKRQIHVVKRSAACVQSPTYCLPAIVCRLKGPPVKVPKSQQAVNKPVHHTLFPGHLNYYLSNSGLKKKKWVKWILLKIGPLKRLSINLYYLDLGQEPSYSPL